MDNTEIWKPCIEAPGVLEVSSLGRVRSLDRYSKSAQRTRNGKVQALPQQLRRGQILAACVDRRGYREVAIMIDSRRKKFRVHRLVARAFVDGYFDGASIDHVDGDKQNNLPSNLEWVTPSENTRRQWETGLVDLRGELHPSAKLTNLQAHAIAVLHENKFPVSQVADWFGISTSMVYKIAEGRRATS